MEFRNRLVESFQKVESLRRDARLDDAAVVGLANPGDQATLLKAIQQAGHIRIVRNHALADAAACQTIGSGATKNAEDIVLRTGQSGSLEELLPFLAERVGRAQKLDEDALL